MSQAAAMLADVPPEVAAQSPILGRDEELGRLVAMVGLEPAGPPGAVLLSGDAGVGKTRLLVELRDRARDAGWRVLVGHCLDFGDSALPYLPFSEVFGRLAAESPELAQSLVAAGPAVARLMPGRRLLTDVDQDRPERMDRSELFEAVSATLRRLSETAPLLLIIEDVHWAESSSREMLSFLFARQSTDLVSVVASYRSDDLHRRHPLRATVAEWTRLPAVGRLQLRPLADPDVRSLVRLLHPAAMSEDDVRGIVARAEGNAFFAEELVSAAESGNRALPTDLADLLLVRLDRLDDAARQLVRTASVAGRRVPHDLLATVVDVDGAPLDAALRAAVESNVLVPLGPDGYGFRHALLAEAVYDDLLPGERVRLHAAYAAALSGHTIEGTAAELARHARAAHDVATAIRASIQAGEEAMAVAGPVEAARHYEMALDLLADGAAPTTEPVDLVALTVRAGEATVAAGDVFRAAALVRDQLAQLPADAEPTDRARLLGAIAGVALVGDIGVDVLQVTTEAMRLVPDEPSTPLRAQVLTMHARANADRRRDDEAARWASDALRLGRELQLADVVADVTTTLAQLEERAGDPVASRRTLEATVADARVTGEVAAELRGLFNLGVLHYEMGRLAEASAVFGAAGDRARQAGRPWAPYGIDARALAGVVAYVSGDWDAARRIVAVDGESPPDMSRALLAAVGLAVAAGRGERAALDVLPTLQPWSDRDGMIAIFSGAPAIDLHGDRGDLASATGVYDDVVASTQEVWGVEVFQAQTRLSALLLGQHAAAAARAGVRARDDLVRRGGELLAVASAGAALGLARGRRHGPEGEAWLARATAEHVRLRWLAGVDVPEQDELMAAWEASVGAFDRFGHVFEIARSQARLAAVLRAAGRPADATAHARAARDVARRLDAEPLLMELRTLAPAGRRRPTESATADPALTAREREVLTLVAQGRSNSDIGRQLYITAKTASVHVSNILAKLGAAGRTEAVAVARRTGLIDDDGAMT